MKKDEKYCERYDAVFDKKKDIWISKKCHGKTCGYCKHRPDKPSQLKCKVCDFYTVVTSEERLVQIRCKDNKFDRWLTK